MMIKLCVMGNCQRLGMRVFSGNNRTDFDGLLAAARLMNAFQTGRICRTVFLLSRIIFGR